MKYLLPLIIISCIILAACKKKNEDKASLLNGSYKGTFKRYNQPGSQEANVTLHLDYPIWHGASDKEKYPALCNGKFSYKDFTLNFENSCVWSADFDWTLILDGFYIDRKEGDSLIFSKSYGDGTVDVYKLKKQ